MKRYSLEELTDALGGVSVPEERSARDNVSRLAGTKAAVFGSAATPWPDMNPAAQAGVGFAALPAAIMNSMLAAMLQLPEIQALGDAARLEGWLKVLFALAHAAQLGA